MTFFKKFSTLALILAASLAALDAYLWSGMLAPHQSAGASTEGTREYFLGVGNGESELVVFAGGAKVLVDAGPQGGGATDTPGHPSTRRPLY